MTSTASIPRTLARVVLVAAAAVLALAGPVAAREPVDPGTLNPPPLDFFNASCLAGGNGTICTLAFADPPFEDEPSGLICDGVELLDSGARSVVGKRFYDADGNLVQRHFRETLDGRFTNPETGRYVLYHAHDTVKHDLAVPGDLSTGATRITGLYVRMWRPGGGTVLSDTGTYIEDPGTFDLLFASGHHPLIDYASDLSAIDPLCAALD